MNRRKIFLLLSLAFSFLLIGGFLNVVAQGEYVILKTSWDSPYNVVLIGGPHTLDDSDPAGFLSPGSFYFTPTNDADITVVQFQQMDPNEPGHWCGGWSLYDSVGYPCAGGDDLQGTGGDWVTHTQTETCTWTAGDPGSLLFGGSNCGGVWLRRIEVAVDTLQNTPTPTPTSITPTATTVWIGGCNLQNYSFSDGLNDWAYGDWVTEGSGWVQIHGNTDQLNSYIAQPISLTATGPSDFYEISISARSPVPVAPENAPFVRWKLNSLIPGDDPDWYGGQALIFSSNYWQHQSWVLRGSNLPAISDTLTIWASGNGDIDVQIDNVCITLHQGPTTATPICPPSPTYTPRATYTPLPTPTAVNSATATAWAATATAWPTPQMYPTQAAPNCSAGNGSEPGFDFIWLMGQIIMLLGAFFEAIFRLLGTVLQPIFDLIGFVVWLLGAAFGLISQLIDLISAALQFLISLLEIAFDILEIVGAFFVALWTMLSATPADPGFVIPADWAWPIAAWNFLIEGTPLELLVPVAMGIGSLLMIIWTIRQFSDWGG